MSKHDERACAEQNGDCACVTPEGPVSRALNAQKGLKPGEQGYWEVFAARAYDIRPGDLVMYKRDGQIHEHEVSESAPWGDLRDTVCPRFRDATGELFNIGAMQPIGLLRIGTHHTLADSA